LRSPSIGKWQQCHQSNKPSMSANQGTACCAVKSTIVTLTSCDDAVFDIKDVFPKAAPMRHVVRTNIVDFACEALLFVAAATCRQNHHCHSHLM
jgi:hypothetical protein